MNNLVKCIQQSIGYIEDHLHEPITIGDIADSVGYSVFHFIRSFNQIVKHTPYDYLMRRRLTRAGIDLVSSNRRIIDIALDYCIGSQESFTRLFRKMFDQTPGQCRAVGGIAWWKTFQAKTAEDLDFSSQLDSKEIRLSEMETIRLQGMVSRIGEGLIDRDDIRASLVTDMIKTFQPQANHHQFLIWSSISREQIECDSYLRFLMADMEDHSGMLMEQTLNGGRVIGVAINQGEQVCAVRYLLSSWMPNHELQPSLPFCLILRKGNPSGLNSKDSLFIRVEEIDIAGKDSGNDLVKSKVV